jgi:transposase
MFTVGGSAKVYLATGATDLRRSFSLHTIAQHRLGFAQPLNGDVFGFINKRRDLVKFFWFAEGGLCVLAKRLPESSFRWPQAGEQTVTITPAQLQLLLSGIDLKQSQARRWWRQESLPPAEG